MAKGQFEKGKSGNPGGRPKELANIQQLARSFADVAVKTLAHVSSKGVSEAARVAASVALLDRGYGKPPQFSTDDPARFRRAVELTDDELAAIASGSGEGPSEPQERPSITH